VEDPRMRRLLPLALLLLAAPLLSAAVLPKKQPPPEWALVGQPGVVTLVNLHPDPGRHRLYSVNYLQMGFIPVCTPVEILSLSEKKMTFRVAQSGVEYEYLFHRSLQGSKTAHLDKIFGPAKTCPRARIAKMSKLDQAGIKEGSVKPGMTKNAVVIALGYPPEHATATLELDQWRYWRNRFNTMLVMFQNDKVSQVRE
jgi:hypothetical protein